MFRCLQILLLTFSYSWQLNLNGIFWDPQNPIFNQALCTRNSRVLHAQLNDELNILCGNPSLSKVFQGDVGSQSTLFNYNVYLTDNSNVYRERNGSKANPIYNCELKKDNQNYVLQSFKFVLSERLPPGQLGKFKGFKEGKSYWLFTTSNGTKSSLNKKVGSSDSMGVEIKICFENTLCEARYRPNLCIEKSNAMISNDAQAQRAETGERKSGSFQKTFQKPEFIIGVLVALVVGIVFGVVVGIKRGQCVREQKEGQDQSSGHHSLGRTRNKVGRNSSTMSQVPMIQEEDDSEIQLSPEV